MWVLEIYLTDLDVWSAADTGTLELCEERLEWYSTERPDLEHDGKLRIRPVDDEQADA